MKKLNKLLFLGILLFASCRPDDIDLTFNKTPDQRMGELQKQVKQQLVEAKYGWRVLSSTLTKGTYGFYMDFDADGKTDRVRMVSDIDNVSSKIVRTSAYRVKLINAPMLSFETYSYIHQLADPDPNVIGGEYGDGLKADIEFELQRTTTDSLFFKGRKFRSEMILIRATREEQQVYLSGGFINVINEVKGIFATNQISLFDHAGVTYQMTINSDSRTLGIMSYVNDKIVTSNDLFSYTADGLQIGKGIPLLNGDVISKILLTGGKLYVITGKGDKQEIRGSQTPLLPLADIMGVMYTRLFSPYRVQYSGTNAAGANILYQVHRQIAIPAPPGSASKIDLDLQWDTINKYIYLQGYMYYSATPTMTRYRYNYTYDKTTGLFKLSNKVVQATGFASVGLMDTFLLNNEFKLEYYFDSGNAYGRVVSKDGSITMTLMPLK
uniref:DUF4302 domain-containing protein n=1 Tax=Pedobacter schmidteae TaxID=2201271 RepID=UPI000EACF17E|nr:DUF4302 domain-containing protein [Pedobacter schmidteae]